jgi:hypothetical protein
MLHAKARGIGGGPVRFWRNEFSPFRDRYRESRKQPHAQ